MFEVPVVEDRWAGDGWSILQHDAVIADLLIAAQAHIRICWLPAQTLHHSIVSDVSSETREPIDASSDRTNITERVEAGICRLGFRSRVEEIFGCCSLYQGHIRG